MKPLVLLSFSLTFLTQAFADDSSAAQPSVQVKEKHNDYLSYEKEPQAAMFMESEDALGEWCLSPYHEMHASIRHNEANGIGYKDGYSTLEAFGIYDGIGSGFMPFVDIRGHIFNNGYLAGNLGIGERTLFTSINHTFGSYLYYDVRRVGHGLTVNQLSPGIELVGEWMEYRINGYFPLGKQKGHQYGFEFDKFTGNSIILKSKQNQAMRGFDAEVGVHIPQNTTYDVYAAAGPYYFHSSNASAWGGKVRVLGRFKEYVTLEVAYSYDKLFRNVVQGSLAFTVPFGGKLQRCGKCCPQTDNLLLSRAAFAPSRFEIPVVKKVHKHEKAIDPATGKPWVVWFVNNTSHSAGTFESPFPTLLDAQNASSPNDMIYVFSGDGTSNGMNLGIQLQDNQKLFGSGMKQLFATTVGNITIPAMSTGQPIIANPAGNAVNCGNNNEISGIHVQSVTTGINCDTVTNAFIHNNTVELIGTATIPPTTDGIVLTGCLGQVTIVNNFFDQTVGGSTAISLISSGPNSNYLIQNNLFNAVVGQAQQAIGFGLVPDFGTLNIANNQFIGYGGATRGIAIGGFGFTGTGNLIIDSNLFSHLTIASIPQTTVYIISNAGSNIIADITNNVWKNTVNPTPHSHVYVQNNASANVCLKLSGNQSDDTANAYILDNAGNTFTADISNNVGTIEEIGVITPGSCP